ncbi:MAG: glycosyltransferase [Planctomycetes bacterium]|nr:glycosyltransferase [Planctomycetota bacterium]
MQSVACTQHASARRRFPIAQSWLAYADGVVGRVKAAHPVHLPAVPIDAARPHILTVSLEEYFHSDALCGAVLQKHWDRFEPRIDRSADRVLKALDQHGAKATFFVLGILAERNQGLVRRIVAAGHEVASHGFWPRSVHGMQVEDFAADLDRAVAAIAAAGGLVRGYRSPRWLCSDDLWVLETLAKKGYSYDASINPVGRKFAALPQFHTVRKHDVAGAERGIFEVPLSVASWAGYRYAVADGHSLRQLPYPMVLRAAARWHRERREPLVCSVTSWEFDPEQPRVTAVKALHRRRQYRNLDCLAERLQGYLRRYRFTGILDHLQRVQGLPVRGPVVVSPLAFPPAPIVIQSAIPQRSTAPLAVSLVVPMFQEEQSIAYFLRTIDAVRERFVATHAITLICVDDCSRDRTWELLSAACEGRTNMQLLRHEQNRGVAAAIQTGIRAASTEIVCSMDCDCSYDPMELLQMIARLGDADLVTASPYHPDGQVLNVPRWRLCLSRTLSFMYRRILGKPLYTWTSCCRVYRRSKVAQIELLHGDFLGMAEMLVRLLRRGGVVCEYPTLLEARLLGVSKMKTLRTVRGHIALLFFVLSGRIR